MFDHERSPRLGQRLAVETLGVLMVADATELPDPAYDGQLVYQQDITSLVLFDGTDWVAV